MNVILSCKKKRGESKRPAVLEIKRQKRKLNRDHEDVHTFNRENNAHDLGFGYSKFKIKFV